MLEIPAWNILYDSRNFTWNESTEWKVSMIWEKCYYAAFHRLFHHKGFTSLFLFFLLLNFPRFFLLMKRKRMRRGGKKDAHKMLLIYVCTLAAFVVLQTRSFLLIHTSSWPTILFTAVVHFWWVKILVLFAVTSCIHGLSTLLYFLSNFLVSRICQSNCKKIPFLATVAEFR